jgi:hypothetical protein
MVDKEVDRLSTENCECENENLDWQSELADMEGKLHELQLKNSSLLERIARLTNPECVKDAQIETLLAENRKLQDKLRTCEREAHEGTQLKKELIKKDLMIAGILGTDINKAPPCKQCGIPFSFPVRGESLEYFCFKCQSKNNTDCRCQLCGTGQGVHLTYMTMWGQSEYISMCETCFQKYPMCHNCNTHIPKPIIDSTGAEKWLCSPCEAHAAAFKRNPMMYD